MHYRVEMLDLDPETGEFTFGDLEAYSAEQGGWFAGGDKAVSKTTKGFMATMTDRGYPAETFAGARMKKSVPRTTAPPAPTTTVSSASNPRWGPQPIKSNPTDTLVRRIAF